MTAKRVVPRERAVQDIRSASLHCAEEVSGQAAGRFIEDVEAAFRWIAEHPGAGSPRYAYELDLPGLRTWTLRRHPYLILYVDLYVDAADHIDVWRVLHARQDIPEWMRGSENG